jgi:PST family polysaccharide transporter
LLGNALALYAVQGLNYLMPLLLLPFLLRALQPQGYGAIVFAQAVLQYAVILVEFGFNFTAARDIAVARDDPAEVARIYWTTTAAKLLLLAVAAVVVGVAVALVPTWRAAWPLYAASSLLLLGNVAFPQWYFQGLERLQDVALIQAATKCVVTLAAVTLVRSPDDLLLAAVILASPQLIAALVGALLRRPLFPQRLHRPSVADVRAAVRQSRDMFVANVASTLYLNTNTFFLGLLSGEVAVAMYSVAVRIVTAVQGLAVPAVQAVFPRASHLFMHDRPAAWRLCRQLATVLLPVMAVASLLLLAFAPGLVLLLGGRHYAQAAIVVRIVAAVPLLVAAAMLLGQVVMVNLGLASQLSRIYLAVGALNLVLLPPLIGAMAERGAAVSLLIAEVLGPLLMLRVIDGARRRGWRAG